MTIYEIVLKLHVVCGFTALTIGLMPMLTRKGSSLHVNSGWIYFWAMFGVFATSSAMFAMKNSLLFLFLIGVFSFYNTLSGVRLLRYKKSDGKVASFDWAVSGIVFCAGLAMIGLGIYSFLIGQQGSAILYTIFGIVCASISNSDLCFLKKVRKREALKKNEWLLRHITRMGGSYIASFTAFVITVGVFPPLIAWLAPGVIGGMIVSVVVKRVKLDYRT